jgi:hypothetical protein
VQVPEEKTLISPVQCKSLWRQFKAETEYTVTQAIAAQVSHKIHLYMCSLCATKTVVPIISVLYFVCCPLEILTVISI